MPREQIPARHTARVLEVLPPFPIVLVTTRTNVITINQLHYLTFSPLRLGVAVAHSRFTYGLLRHEGEFVVNVPDESMIEAVRLCGSVSGRDRDKFEAASLGREKSSEVEAASIAQCGASIECRVEREIDFEERTWFVGRVVAARRREGHTGARALTCGRHEYALPGPPVAPR